MLNNILYRYWAENAAKIVTVTYGMTLIFDKSVRTRKNIYKGDAHFVSYV